MENRLKQIMKTRRDSRILPAGGNAGIEALPQAYSRQQGRDFYVRRVIAFQFRRVGGFVALPVCLSNQHPLVFMQRPH